jgi:hypothetical protein
MWTPAGPAAHVQRPRYRTTVLRSRRATAIALVTELNLCDGVLTEGRDALLELRAAA